MNSSMRDRDDTLLRALALKVDPLASAFDLTEAEPLDRRTVPDQLAQRIIALVKSGNIKAGDRLPSETEIASAFQISRPSVREGLKMLRMLGVVESRQGGRYYVTDLSPGRLMKSIQFVVLLEGYDIGAHLDAREAVDIPLVRKACEHATDAHIQKIMMLAETGYRFVHDPVGFRLMDFEFHQTINSAARSPLLARISLSLQELGLELRRIACETPGTIETSLAAHDAIAEAIAGRDADRAEAAYRRHLDDIRATTVAAAESMHRDRRAAKGTERPSRERRRATALPAKAAEKKPRRSTPRV